MYSISDMKVSYSPGSGYTGTIPGCPATIRWGDEFLAQLKAAQQTAGTSGNAESISPRSEPTKEDISELAEKYNPKNMSQEEYDSFLEDMVDKGILRKDEIGQLGYHGLVVVGSFAEGAGFGIWNCSAEVKDIAGAPFGLGYSLSDAGGDVLAWAKLNAIFRPGSASSDGLLSFVKKGSDAFETIVDILEAMEKDR